MNDTTAEPEVLFKELPTDSGHVLGQIVLNRPRAINALTLNMIELIDAKLGEWRDRQDLIAIMLLGAGERGLCAGGDVVKVANQSASYTDNTVGEYPLEFFSKEYRCDYHLHTFGKPVICWADGICMGGGKGLMAAANHRVVTERSRLAMPEVNIGLFPDVGGSLFLNEMPGHAGLFMGMTGAHFSGADAMALGVADHYIDSGEFGSMLDALLAAPYMGTPDDNQLVATALNSVAIPAPSSDLAAKLAQIDELLDGEDLGEIATRLKSFKGDEFIEKWVGAMFKGAPVTPWLVFEQMRRAETMSLADVFRMELGMAIECVHQGHFKEGVRALLIDKDKSPQFSYASLFDVPASEVKAHFEARWPAQEHPLVDLR